MRGLIAYLGTGVSRCAGDAVSGIEADGEGPDLVLTEAKPFLPAETVVVAAGAWTRLSNHCQ